MDFVDPVNDDQGLQQEVACILGLNDIRRNFRQGFFKIRVIPSHQVVQFGIQNTPLASAVEVNYLFSCHPQLRQRYLSAFQFSDSKQGSIRFGKIVEEMDALAGDCCYKYMV